MSSLLLLQCLGLEGDLWPGHHPLGSAPPLHQWLLGGCHSLDTQVLHHPGLLLLLLLLLILPGLSPATALLLLLILPVLSPATPLLRLLILPVLSPATPLLLLLILPVLSPATPLLLLCTVLTGQSGWIRTWRRSTRNSSCLSRCPLPSCAP